MPRSRLLLIVLIFASALFATGAVAPVSPKASRPNPRSVVGPPRPPVAEPERPEPPRPDIDQFRGNQFQWARLRTSNPYWNRHSGADLALVDYLRRATVLKIDPVWHSVRADSIDDLNVYPFIYCDNIAHLSPFEAANFGEYLRRGGFFCIDACQHVQINRSIPIFLREQIAVLAAQLPKLRTEELSPSHEIFSVFFKLKYGPPPRKTTGEVHPLQAVYDGERLIGVISLNGLQCGWSDSKGGAYPNECAQMMANIYVYAMTR
ncbi:MAG: DUF4159 domain-containing protein [Opitutaceae bacterium]